MADMRALRAAGAWGCAVATAVTVQSTQGLRRCENVATSTVVAQLEELFEDMTPRSLKTGALGKASTARAVADVCDRHPGIPLVVDPVLAPTRGDAKLLSPRDVVSINGLMRRATVVTPNLAEAEIMLRTTIENRDQAHAAAQALQQQHGDAVLLKGGHLPSTDGWLVDWLATSDGVKRLRHRRLRLPEIHGTGCTLASLIAGGLAATPPSQVPGELEAIVRKAGKTLRTWMRRTAKLGRGLHVMLALALVLVVGRADAQPVCRDTCPAPVSALDVVAQGVAAGLGGVPDGAAIGISPIEAPRGGALATKIARLVSGRIGPATKVVGVGTLEQTRQEVGNAPGFVYLAARIAAGRLHVSADAYPNPTTVWARARSAQPGPRKHAAVQAPIDAEVRSYLPPLSFDSKPTTTQYDGADPDMLALACGDLDGDGINDLVTMNRTRVLRVRLHDGTVERVKEANWANLAAIAPTPLRQPLGFATIVEGPTVFSRRGYLDVSITDRVGSARLDSELALVRSVKGITVPHGRATACTGLDSLLLADKLVSCSEPEPAPAIQSLEHRSDAMASAHVTARDGSGRTLAALRRAHGLVVHDGRAKDVVPGRIGAQLAVGDLDQDGAPELVTTMDVLSRKFDALEVRTLTDGKPVRRFRLPAPMGIEALTICPPDGAGVAAIVFASKGALWVVR